MVVEVVHWNPRRPRSLRRIDNFGDLLGPKLVGAVRDIEGLRQPRHRRRLLTIGSIMKLSQPGDVVWGTGVNGKSMDAGAAPDLDVRAVRGPLTADLLRRAGTIVPDVYGDPALLWSHFFRPDPTPDGRDVLVVPNLHDWQQFEKDPRAISPTSPPDEVIRRIVSSEFVCGSSLHGIVLAEAFGIPARLVQPRHEPLFKYEDYYLGSGRESAEPARTVRSAIEMGGVRMPRFNGDLLLAAFPRDLWRQRPATTSIARGG